MIVGIRAEVAGGAGADILGFLQWQVDDVTRVQQRLPAGEQVVQANADRDAGIDAGAAYGRLDGLAAMGERAVRSCQDDQFRFVDGVAEGKVASMRARSAPSVSGRSSSQANAAP